MTDFAAIGRVNYIDRGDITAPDFTQEDLTRDGSYHDLDLSAIVPVAAKHINLSVDIAFTNVGDYILFRENGNSNGFNRLVIQGQVSSVYNYIEGFVRLDSDRKIEYRATNNVDGVIFLLVRGWII